MGVDAHQELVRAAIGGDTHSIGRLFERHLPGLIAFVRARVGPRLAAREDTLDLAQSACRELLEDLSECELVDEAGFKRWLYRAAENKIRDRARFHARDKRDAYRVRPLEAVEERELEYYRQGVSGFFTPSRAAMAREELAALEDALAALPEDYRDVILLARVVGLDHARVAEQMGRSNEAVRILLHRAIARLARLTRHSLGG